MRERIFKGSFIIALLVLAACMVLIMGALYIQYNNEYAEELKNQAYMVGHGVEQSGEEYFDGLEVPENYRITWIAPDGSVLLDSSVKGVSGMENHKDRPEVSEALERGYGEDSRFSSTIAEKTMYSAVRLKDGSVLRVSKDQLTIFTVLLIMLQPLLVILLMAVVISFMLAARTAKKIVEPLNCIDLDRVRDVEVYEEVQPLVDKIAEQKEALDLRISRLQVDVDEKTREADFRKEFTANVSHELKTPLTSISGFAEIIRNGIVKEEDIPRFAGRIYDEAQRLITLVEDIIKLSQLDEKQIAAEKESIDLYLACQDVLFTQEAAAREKHITLELTGEHVYVEAVEQILSEIIYNLCDNGIKYNREYGTVTVHVFEEEGHPALRVTDTGIGIPEEDLDRVFERFFRVNKSHSKEIGGTGLGLSIVKHGAAYHNAAISIDSSLGEGTSVTVVFQKQKTDETESQKTEKVRKS